MPALHDAPPTFYGGPLDGDFVERELESRYAILHPTKHSAAFRHLYSRNITRHTFDYQGETTMAVT